MSTTKQSKASALTQVQAIIAGTQKHFPNGSFTLGNTAYTTATLTQALKSLANGLSALSAAHVGVKDAGQTVKGLQATVGPVLRTYQRYLLATFASAPLQLADFGMQPTKVRAPLNTEQRAVATAKLRSTRSARGTTGKKQKLAVKGSVTAVEITPVAMPASSAAGASPAATTTGSLPAAASPAATPAAPASAAPIAGAVTK
jgi:hypothetical protein